MSKKEVAQEIKNTLRELYEKIESKASWAKDMSGNFLISSDKLKEIFRGYGLKIGKHGIEE